MGVHHEIKTKRMFAIRKPPYLKLNFWSEFDAKISRFKCFW